MPGAEDDVSIQRHISTMQAELAKAVPNNDVIKDRMSRTLVQRRADIKSLRIEDVLVKYPALSHDSEVRRCYHENVIF